MDREVTRICDEDVADRLKRMKFHHFHLLLFPVSITNLIWYVIPDFEALQRESLSVVFDRSPFGLRSSFIKSFHCFFPPLFLFQLFRFPVLIWFGALSLGIDLGLRGFILGFPFWGFFLEFIYEDLVVGFQIRLGLGLLFFQYFVLLVGMGGFGLELLFS